MNIAKAKKIVGSGMTVKDIKDILSAAHDRGFHSEARSAISASMSIGAVFNLLWWSFFYKDDAEIITGTRAVNVVIEFGEYMHGKKPKGWKKAKVGHSDFYHAEPIDIYSKENNV